VLRFPLPILIPPTAPHLSSINRGWYNRPLSGLSTKWTQSHPTKNNKEMVELSVSVCVCVCVCVRERERERERQTECLDTKCFSRHVEDVNS
jgi:hypothetical protein